MITKGSQNMHAHRTSPHHFIRQRRQGKCSFHMECSLRYSMFYR